MLITADFGRDICGDLAISERREWLVTNGIGGYAAGSIAGVLTRRYHGLLIAALAPPLGRMLLLTKLDECLQIQDRSYFLQTNRWLDGTVDPRGHHYLEQFYLEDNLPVWIYACEDVLLEKRIWMEQGSNTTYIRYTLKRGIDPVKLSLKALGNYRDHHGTTYGGDWQMQITALKSGLAIQAFEGAVPFYLQSDPDFPATFTPIGEWFRAYQLRIERERGLPDQEDHLHLGTIEVTLDPGQSFTCIATTDPTLDPNPDLNGEGALQRYRTHTQGLLQQSLTSLPTPPEWIQQLVLAADQFIVKRSVTENPEGKSIIAGYPWFGDWGRDTMISLSGLTLVTGRFEVARSILKTFAQFVDQGMLPNRFPDAGEIPEYNTVDATLWYFEALRAYVEVTEDWLLVKDILPRLAEIIDWHCRGTRYHIHRDPKDGLLYAGETGVQLTWMDAKVGDWVVTPRIGKPIEVNALWIHALRILIDLGQAFLDPSQLRDLEAMNAQATEGFQRFWNAETGYCYDVLDGPEGSDLSLRPNQILAVALPLSILSSDQERAIVQTCGRTLLTSHGLRSLSAQDPKYQGYYGGDPLSRDGAYHQGTVWGWLLGSFALAHFKVYQDPIQAQELLNPMRYHLHTHGVGSLSEIFDGNPPFIPRGCTAQAWTVAEILRAWWILEKSKKAK